MWFQSWKTVNRKGLRKLLDVENRHTTGKNFVGAEEIARDKKVVDEHTAQTPHLGAPCKPTLQEAPVQLEGPAATGGHFLCPSDSLWKEDFLTTILCAAHRTCSLQNKTKVLQKKFSFYFLFFCTPSGHV